MRKIIEIRTAAPEQNINILHANWNISDGGFDTKHLNIIYYQNINQMILMDILQQSLLHIHCKPLYLKCLDERLRLFSNICIMISVSKRFEKIITRKTSLHKALLVTFPHTHLPIAGAFQ